ncbi:MAG: DUF1189 domain-containing protein, partial [Candidatus Obscuribacterales bacterium]|nr:DUF1189 domain-containing protein [Candidatus Obscuribacterales bacterium]
YKGCQKEIEFEEDWLSTFDAASYRQPLQYLRDYSALCLFFVLTFAGLLTQLLKALILGLVGKALGFLNRRSLSYPQLVRLSVVAMVPALLIDTLQRLLAVSMPYWSFLSFALAIAYLVFGIRSNSVAINRVSQEIES